MTAINRADARDDLRRWREVEKVQRALDQQQPIEPHGSRRARGRASQSFAR